LRAGLLSQPRVIEVLNGELVPTWILGVELEELAKNALDPQERALGEKLKSEFKGLVDMVIVSPDGKLLATQNMNDIIQDYPGAREPDEKLLRHFLGFVQTDH
jgi:hypothetical protein